MGDERKRPRMEQDYLYENAPLIEVIAEVFWSLLPLTALPGAAIDPHFPSFSEQFRQLAHARGYVSVERTIPEGMPLELIGGQPVFRFRTKPGSWPLYQIGPGIFTCNIVPPYDGWAAFRRSIKDGLDMLFDAFPAAEKNLKVQNTSLRYVDGFTARHGLSESSGAFVAEHLGVSLRARDQFLHRFSSDPSRLIAAIEAQFPLKEPAETLAVVKVAPGQKDGQQAVIVELRATGAGGAAPEPSREAILGWMDAAHRSLHDLFEFMTSEELKKHMGPKRPIGGNVVER